MNENLMEKIVALCKRRGFIYPSSEIYGGITGFWDYGPLGVELKRNIKNEWWKAMVQARSNVVGLDAAIIMNPQVWKASGHLDAFTDPLVECKNCHSRFRVDRLIHKPQNLEAVMDEIIVNISDELKKVENNLLEYEKLKGITGDLNKKYNTTPSEKEKVELKLLIEGLEVRVNLILEENSKKLKITTLMLEDIGKEFKAWSKFTSYATLLYLNKYEHCSICDSREWSWPKQFNLLTEVYLGVTEPKQKVYLRGEITQGAFVNFENVVNSTRVKIPFGIAQIGKAFRNEITPGNFTFRSREFEQMELEFFIKNDEKEGEKWFEYWKQERIKWYESLGIKKENIRTRVHEDTERAHYARHAEDIEYKAPFGWSEFEGIHNRGDWDLTAHKLRYKEEDASEFTPWVIETSGGVDRAALFFLVDSYTEDGDRKFLKLSPKLAPFKAAVFPLLANKPELVNKAKGVFDTLKSEFMIAWDERGNIGKRYFAQDEIGTPFCLTIDFQTLDDETVTVRDRDSGKQIREKIENLPLFIKEKLGILTI